jgi:hypothetical protein
VRDLCGAVADHVWLAKRRAAEQIDRQRPEIPRRFERAAVVANIREFEQDALRELPLNPELPALLQRSSGAFIEKFN